MHQAIQQQLAGLDSTDAFHDVRQQARTNFEALGGLPTRRSEAYQHTSITDYFTHHLNTTISTTSTQEALSKHNFPHYDLDAYHVVVCNGRLHHKRTKRGGQPPGVHLLTFQEAYQQRQPLFLEHFFRKTPSHTDAFVAMNTAFFEEGIFIHITDQTIVDKPLIIHHYTSLNVDTRITYPRLLVVLGERSQASIVTSWQTSGLINAVTEGILQEGARLTYYTLQTDLGSKHGQVNTAQFQQASRSTLHTYTFTWSGGMIRNNLCSNLEAPYSEAGLYGLYCLRGKQHVDNATAVHHYQAHTRSDELYKGILMEEATGVFNGRICVHPEAQKTDAWQTNNNLVLSDRAALHTKPQLAIEADEVRCTHGATTGQLDEAQLFYLQARGLSRGTAQHLLQQAFASEVLDKVPLTTLRDKLYASLATRTTLC